MLHSFALESLALQRFGALARSFGRTVYLVGGSIRDQLLGLEHPVDLDLIVDGEVLPLLQAWRSQYGDPFIPLDPEWGIYRLFTSEGVLDVARMQGSIGEDLLRRDLTVNALGWGPLDQPEQSLLDPAGGLPDLEAGRIRVIRPENLRDDPLRLLRVFRFAATLRFSIDPESLGWIRENAPLIEQVSAERIAVEWFKLLAVPSHSLLPLMQEVGLLFELLPELSPLLEIPPNDHHHLDALHHSFEAVRVLEALLADPSWLGELAPRVWENLQAPLAKERPRISALKFATLLHDVGKAGTYELREGRPRFIGHDRLGGEIIGRIARRLKLSGRERLFLENCVRHHMRPGLLSCGEVSPRAIYRFFRDTGEDGVAVLLLAMADRLAAQGPVVEPIENERLQALVLRMLDDFFRKPEAVAPTPLLDGHEVMETLGLGPGPRVGALLEQLKEAQVGGIVHTREESLIFLREAYSRARA